MVREVWAHFSADENYFTKDGKRYPYEEGMGPYEYLIKIRALHAMELLRDKSLSIGEIALRCGFCDSNHLCKIFKQQLIYLI